jgi:hypothetical protein
MPRKRIPADLRSLARGHTELCIKVLAGMLSQEAVPAAARVSAAGILLDRGWGKPAQPHTGEDDKDIRVAIRTITERRNDRHRPAAQRLVVHHSGFDVLIPSHSRMGKFSGGKRISMLRGTPGWRRMKPFRSRVTIIWWTDGGLTRKWRWMSASAGGCPNM